MVIIEKHEKIKRSNSKKERFKLLTEQANIYDENCFKCKKYKSQGTSVVCKEIKCAVIYQLEKIGEKLEQISNEKRGAK